VFRAQAPYAVLSWSHTDRGDVPDKFCELNRKLLKHDRPDDAFYRYEGEIKDRASEGKALRYSSLGVPSKKLPHPASRRSVRPKKSFGLRGWRQSGRSLPNRRA